jgi:uncharacterized RDD family membrane protein YckC/large-conductance mechanosensitive channel
MPKKLSNAETKEIVTPYAFSVSPELLGQPLATPTRRGIAIVIDVFLISVLSTISALIFAAFVALTFFKADAKIKKRVAADQKGAMHYTRLLLRGSGAILIFFVAFMVVKGFENETNETDEPMTPDTGIKIVELVFLLACKDDLVCVQDAGKGLASSMANTDINEEAFANEMRDLLNDTSFSEAEKTSTLALFQEAFLQERTLIANTASNTPEEDLSEINIPNPLELTQPSMVSQAPPSIITWAKGVMSDLGLGLGWAALYFSVFTAWANGQTIGKKICSIKVVRLDGETPTLWESFERYGGYGAGFATGLLGFLQLYWDPNRQAIQDKISETLVLRISKPAKNNKTEVAEIKTQAAIEETR